MSREHQHTAEDETIEALEQEMDVETLETDEVEEVAAEVKPKKEKKPTRGDLPEGYVTPVGLAHALTEEFGKEIAPQVVYSYIKNAPADRPFPIGPVTDSNGVERNALPLEEGLQWWRDKDKAVAERKKRSAEKKAEKEAKAAAAANAVTEVEDTAEEMAEAE